MPAKPGSKNWDDIKMVMSALAIATTLGLWNLFATLDKPVTTQKTIELQPSSPAVVSSPTEPVFNGKILLGGQAPSQQIIVVQSSKNSRNSQQSAPVTRTRSS
ncbi:MAG: hypothetical protein QM730_30540 [Anaerolineales bacterium]